MINCATQSFLLNFSIFPYYSMLIIYSQLKNLCLTSWPFDSFVNNWMQCAVLVRKVISAVYQALRSCLLFTGVGAAGQAMCERPACGADVGAKSIDCKLQQTTICCVCLRFIWSQRQRSNAKSGRNATLYIQSNANQACTNVTLFIELVLKVYK